LSNIPVELTKAEIKFIDQITRLDLEAIGFLPASLRVAAGLRDKVVGARKFETDLRRETPREIREHEPLRVLRLTGSYRHEDK